MPLVFNGVTRQIEVTDSAIFSLDVEKDIYSEWKRWLQLDPKNGGYAPAFFSFGGNGTAPGQTAPKYFFLQNYWQMKIDNGNVVSIGLNLYTEDYVTPYIIVAGSGVSDRNSDAVSVNSEDIQFSSYSGGITVDIDNISGRAVDSNTFPAGTLRQPVRTLENLNDVATGTGIYQVYVLGDITLDNSFSWEGYVFVGESTNKTTINIPANANVLNCEYTNAFVSGTLDGSSVITDGEISGLDFIEGEVNNCFIGPGDIKLGVGSTANIIECYSSIPGPSAPTCDMNGTGVLALRNYFGGIKLTNYTGSSAHSIDLSSGQVILDSATITSGTFVVRGEGKLIDENGDRILTGTWNGGVTVINETSDVRTLLLEEVHQIQGLNIANPVVGNDTNLTSGDIDIEITGDCDGTQIMTRQ